MTSTASTLPTSSGIPGAHAPIPSIAPPKIAPIAITPLNPANLPKPTITTLPMPKSVSTNSSISTSSTVPSTIPSVTVAKPIGTVTPANIVTEHSATSAPPATSEATKSPAPPRTIPGLEGIVFSSIPHREIKPVSECYRIKKVEIDNYSSMEKERIERCQTQFMYVQAYTKMLLTIYKQNSDLNKKLLNYFQKIMAKTRKIFEENNTIIKIIDINSNPDILTDDLFKKLTAFQSGDQEKVGAFMKGIQAEIYPLLDPLIKTYNDEYNTFEDKVNSYVNLLSHSSRVCGQFFDQLSTTYTSVRKFEAGDSNEMGDLLPDIILYYGHLSSCIKLFSEYNNNIKQFLADFLTSEKNRYNTIKTIFEKYQQLTTEYGQPIPADILQIPTIDSLEKKIQTQIDEIVEKLGEKSPLLQQPIADNVPNILDSHLIVKYGTVALFKGNEEWMNTTGVLTVDDNLFLYVIDQSDLNGSFKNDKEKLHKTIRIKLSEISKTDGYPNTLTLFETITTLRFFKTNNKYYINVGNEADLADWSKCFHDLQTNNDVDDGPINL